MKSSLIHVVAGICLLAVSPAFAQPAKDPAVVEVGDKKIAFDQLVAELQYIPAVQLETLSTDDNAARVFAVKWYSDLLFHVDAKQSGFFAKKPGLKAASQAAARGFVARVYLRDLLDGDFAITDEEREQLFRLEGDRVCKQPARYRVARAGVIFGKKASESEKESALARMSAIVERLDSGEPFPKVADELSDLAGKLPGGEVGWVTATELGSAPGSDEIKNLAPGEHTAVIETPQGQVVYAVVEREDERKLSMPECRTLLDQSIQRNFAREVRLRRVDELAEELGASMNLDAFLKALKSVPASRAATGAPSGP